MKRTQVDGGGKVGFTSRGSFGSSFKRPTGRGEGKRNSRERFSGERSSGLDRQQFVYKSTYEQGSTNQLTGGSTTISGRLAVESLRPTPTFKRQSRCTINGGNDMIQADDMDTAEQFCITVNVVIVVKPLSSTRYLTCNILTISSMVSP